MKLDRLIPIVLITITTTLSCGTVFPNKSNSSQENNLIEEENRGCTQGVMLNGLTGERLAIDSGDSMNGVEVIVRNKVYTSQTHINGKDENAPERLRGEYYICGIPLDNDFPIVARAEGFQDFEGVVHIKSSLKQRTPESNGDDIALTHPTQIANVFLYPKGTEAQDLKFQLLYEGAPLEGATVQLKTKAENTIFKARDTSGSSISTLRPQIRVVPQRQVSDKNGFVTFSGKQLILGGNYDYVIIPAEMGHQAAIKQGSISVGYRSSAGTSLTQKTFVKTISLDDASPKLELVHSTYESESSSHPNGVAILWFNREIELTPASSDAQKASLSGSTQAKLFAEGTNESFKVDIKGNRMTLTPVWLKKPISTETGLMVQFRGIQVRPAGSRLSSEYKSLGNIGVRIFDR